VKKGKVTTELGAWLKAATRAQQEELCLKTDTAMPYLRLLSNAYRENPKVRLALSLIHEANKISSEHNALTEKHMPYLTLMGLATPTRRGLTWTPADGYIGEVNDQ